MRSLSLPSTLLVLLLLAACSGGAPAEPPAPVFTPVGSWSFMVDVQDQTLTGTMRIAGSERMGWTGSMISEMGEAMMSDIQVMGTMLRFSLPQFDGASGRVRFEGDVFEGSISTDMGMIPIRGMRRDPTQR